MMALRASPPVRRFLFFFLVFAIVFLSDRGTIGGDGAARWEALQSLMESGTLTQERFSLIQPILSVPLYQLGDIYFRATTKLPRGAARYEAERTERIQKFVQRFNKIVVFLISLWFFAALRAMFGFSDGQAAAATIFLLFGSTLLPQAKDYYSECLWTLLSALGLYQAARLLVGAAPRTAGAYALLLVPTALVIPLNPLLAPAMAAAFLGAGWIATGREGGASRPPRTLRALLHPVTRAGGAAVALGLLLALGENHLRRGAFTDFGYSAANTTALFWPQARIFVGLIGHLFSPTRGAVFFFPAFLSGFVLLRRGTGAPEAGRRLFQLVMVYAAILVLGYANWVQWHGGWGWGARFLTPLSLFGAMYLAVWFRTRWRAAGAMERGTMLLLAAASVLVFYIGAAVNDIHLKQCLIRTGSAEACYWDWGNFVFTSLVRPGDWARMVQHRTFAVLAGGLLLYAALTKFGLLPRLNERETSASRPA